MTTWITIVVAGAGCYLLRISLVAVLGRREPSARATRVAGHVMPAAFGSLAAAALLRTGDEGASHAAGPALGAVVTAVVAARTASSTTALIAGLTTVVVATTITPL